MAEQSRAGKSLAGIAGIIMAEQSRHSKAKQSISGIAEQRRQSRAAIARQSRKSSI